MIHYDVVHLENYIFSFAHYCLRLNDETQALKIVFANKLQTVTDTWAQKAVRIALAKPTEHTNWQY